MLFNSFNFLLFFPVVTFIYFLLPYRFRWIHLLTASCIFYIFFIPAYIFILAVTILIDYWAGIKIEESEGPIKKRYLIISIISTCLVLLIFKYFNFFNTNFAAIAEFFGLNYPVRMMEIILPIGLSFHTFQSLSYVIEVYRGKQKTERHFGIYSLYVMFYPQLVAGPIERPQNLLHQFYQKFDFDYNRVTYGLKLMAWGLFKKVVIADQISLLVDQVYKHPQSYVGFPLIFSTVLFAFQIYCDFSGYSDIAIGSAKVMGFSLMQNFNRPYFSKSISEFWKRWHISLSTWFRDYLYIPLGGNRVGKIKLYRNLMITFMVSGLWHGASWSYVIWGLLHGSYLVFALMTSKIKEFVNRLLRLRYFLQIHKTMQVVTTFSLVCFAWVFFRAEDFKDAIYIVTHSVYNIVEQIKSISIDGSVRSKLLYLSFGRWHFIEMMLALLLLVSVHLIERKQSIVDVVTKLPGYVRWSIYYSATFAIMYFSMESPSKQFIYYQF